MKKKNQKRVKAGKDNAQFRWAKRYNILVALTAFYGKDRQTEFMKNWPTKNLQQLLNWHKRHRK